jgi:ACS family tartrate transporter-like MFS transporter
VPAGVAPVPGSLESRAIARVRWRLIPFLALLYFFAYLDRVNVGFASLQMNDAVGLSPADYGFGAGIFFFGYFLFEIPSNLVLQKVGARLWIARILIVWGVISVSMAAVVGAKSFWTLRFLLGAAEAGFYPGILYYLTLWFPARHRAAAVAQFATASMVAGIVGSPLSGLLLSLNGHGGLQGWQWLFVIEGLPSILLGVAVLALLTDRPEEARWLADDEKTWLVDTLREEHSAAADTHHGTLGAAVRDPQVWWLAANFFLLVVAGYGFNFWVPQIVKGLSGGSNLQVGGLTALPYLLAAIGMVTVAAHSDRSGERRWHSAGAALVATAGFATSVLLNDRPVASFIALCVAALGTFAATPPFWSLPTAFLRGAAAAGGIALINSVGNLGGFAGPYLVGWLKDWTGSFSGGLLVLAAAPALAALMTLRVKPPASA